MDIEDLHLACLASVPAGGGPCQLDDDEVGNGTWKPPKNASGSSARWRLFSKVTEMDRIKAQARTPSILSCSRRTDVPWAFLRQYLKAFREGFLYVRSPVTGEMDPVCVIPYNATTGKGVLCISWWSKNYSKWIEEFQKEDSILHSYPLHMFNFTVNSDDKVLEPGLSSCLKERLGVQEMDLPQDVKDLYKTVWEIKQRRVLDMAADRGAYIDQSQSLNIHMVNATTAKLSSMHCHGWEKGLKTGLYYLRTKAAADAIKFTVDVDTLKKSGSDSDSTTATVKTTISSTSSTSSGSLEKSVIQSLKAEGPKYTCENCSS